MYSDADAAARQLNRAQGSNSQIIYSLAPTNYRDLLFPNAVSEHKASDVFTRLDEYRRVVKGDRRNVIAIVDGDLMSDTGGNLFGHHQAKAGNVVITVKDSERYVSSRVAYMAFFFLRYAMSFICPTRMSHPENPSCIFHNRKYKPSLTKAIYAGNLCDPCRKELAKNFNAEIHRAVDQMRRDLQKQLPPRGAPSKQRRALLLKGGGVKGLALVGAILELEKHYEFDAFAGTSAGAIVASLMAFNRSSGDLEGILQKTNFQRFADGKHWKLWNLFRYRYLHPGEEFEKWFWLQIKDAYNKRTQMTQVPKVMDADWHLVMYATQANRGLVQFDSDDPNSERMRPVTFAVRASMSIPGVFKAPTLDGQNVYDGGLLANFPGKEWVAKYPDRDFLGIYLGSRNVDPNRKSGIAGDALDILVNKDDYPFIDKHRSRVVMVDPSPISTTQFGLGKPEMRFLVLEGRASALEHMARYLPDQQLESKAKKRRKLADYAKTIVIARARARWWKRFGTLALVILVLLVLWMTRRH